jgi:hypothetical protein
LSPLERGAGVCSPPLTGGVEEGEHLILLQEPPFFVKFSYKMICSRSDARETAELNYVTIASLNFVLSGNRGMKMHDKRHSLQLAADTSTHLYPLPQG